MWQHIHQSTSLIDATLAIINKEVMLDLLLIDVDIQDYTKVSLIAFLSSLNVKNSDVTIVSNFNTKLSKVK